MSQLPSQLQPEVEGDFKPQQAPPKAGGSSVSNDQELKRLGKIVPGQLDQQAVQAQLNRKLEAQSDAALLKSLDNRKKLADRDRLVLEVKELRKEYNGRPVLKGLDFEVYAGQIIGILGMNAAGKTTLFKSLLGVTPHEGLVKIDGISNNTSATSVLWVPNGMEDDMTVKENMRYYFALYGRRWDQYEARNLISQFGIGSTWDTSFKFLSTGQRRKLAIMRTFIKQNVSLYLMDQPTSGLDILSQNRFVQILRKRLKQARGCALVITHNAQDLQRRVDRILVLNEGRVMAFGTLDQLSQIHMKGYLIKAFYGPDADITSTLVAVFKQHALYYSLEQGLQMNSLMVKVPDLKGFESTYRQISKYFTFVSLEKQNLNTFIELTLSGRRFELAL